MQAATAGQPPSRHQKHYVPIVAGTLEGCGLIFIIGCLIYLFVRMQHQRLERRVPVCTQGFKRYGPRLVMHAMSSLPTKGATDFGFNAPWPGPAEVIGVHFDDPPPAQRSIEYISQASYASLDGPSWIDLEAREPRNRDLDAGSLHRHLFRGRYSPIDHKTLSNLYASPDVEPSHEEEPPPDINLELENLADWNLNNNFSDLDALPCANYDPETDFDIEYQNLFASTVPASSIEETGREEELRIDFDLEPENLINWGPNVSCPALSALPFANVDIRTDLGSIHENASTFNVQMHPDLGTSRGYDSSTLYNNPSRSSQPKTTSISPPAPSASTSILPNDLPLGPPQTSSEPSISQSLLHAPPKADPLPLPPASNFCCPNCRGKFSSRLRLENHEKTHKRSLCDVVGCGKDFTTPKDLRRHRKTVHADRYGSPSQVLKCEEHGCGYSTRRKDHLKRHANTHQVGRKKDS